jgi:hypothetical protein
MFSLPMAAGARVFRTALAAPADFVFDLSNFPEKFVNAS